MNRLYMNRQNYKWIDKICLYNTVEYFSAIKRIKLLIHAVTLLLLLLSHFSRVRLCATPETAAHQAPSSLGFSRQEHWSGLPFPSPMHESEKRKGSRSVVSDSWRPHGLQPSRLLHPWDLPGKSTGVGCHRLLQLWHWWTLKIVKCKEPDDSVNVECLEKTHLQSQKED